MRYTPLDELETIVEDLLIDDTDVVTYGTAAPANTTHVRCLVKSKKQSSGLLDTGYIEKAYSMPEKFTLQIKFKPNFAFDTATTHTLLSWYVAGGQRFYVEYNNNLDQFLIRWQDGVNLRNLVSAQYDGGAALRNVNQWLTLTGAIDLSTGTTAGSALWMDKTQDDTTWSGAINALSTEFNKLQIRAYNGTAGDYDIAYVRLFPNKVATDAEVQAGLVGGVNFPLEDAFNVAFGADVANDIEDEISTYSDEWQSDHVILGLSDYDDIKFKGVTGSGTVSIYATGYYMPVDSSWLDLTLQNDYEFSDSTNGKLRYRKIGDVVHMATIGNVKHDDPSGSTILATLPVGYRPAYQYRAAVRDESDNATHYLTINTDGTIVVSNNYGMVYYLITASFVVANA